jgi:monoamine oxidase
LHASLIQQRGEKSVLLNRPVQAIRQRGKSWSLEIAGDEIWEVDDIVLTVPPSTWSKIAFEPSLPGDLTVPLAASTKYIAVTSRPVWKDHAREPNAMATSPIQLTWETTAGQGNDGHHALVAYAGGDAADEVRGWTPQERDSRVRTALDQFFPGYAQAMVGSRFLDWMNDPWSKGSYSFPAPGQVTTVGPQLDRGLHDHLHFAGEYACYAFTGWMEGALASGVRVAHKLAKRDGVATGEK